MQSQIPEKARKSGFTPMLMKIINNMGEKECMNVAQGIKGFAAYINRCEQQYEQQNGVKPFIPEGEQPGVVHRSDGDGKDHVGAVLTTLAGASVGD